MHSRFTYTRTSTTPDGGSAFEDVTVSLVADGQQRAISDTFDAATLSFRYTPGDYAWDWHTAPRRRLIVILDGELEVVVTNGETRRFKRGDILEVGDTHGRGHISRSANGNPFWSAFIDRDDAVVRSEPNTHAISDTSAAPQNVNAFQTRAGDDGASINDTVHLPFVDVRRSGSVTADLTVTGFQVAWAAGDLDSGWHTTGRRQVVLPLTGGMDVEANVGGRMQIGPGGIYFSEDLSGSGHRTRAIDGQPRMAIFVHLT